MNTTKNTLKFLTVTVFSMILPHSAFGRTIFLNGVDISSARGQSLKNVEIQINDKGEIFITAPHYQVREEETFVPLSSKATTYNMPPHQLPQSITTANAARPEKEVVESKDKPAQTAESPAAKVTTLSEPLTDKNGIPAPKPTKPE